MQLPKINFPKPRIIYKGLIGIAGIVIGYKLGSEAAQYAKTIAENPDTLAYIVNRHPTLVHLVSMGITTMAFNEISDLGELVVNAFSKNKKDSE